MNLGVFLIVEVSGHFRRYCKRVWNVDMGI